MIVLTKEQLHILDPCEGNEIILSATVNDKGDRRGLVFNTWQQAGKQYPNTSVKVYPEATIRVIPAGMATQQQVAHQQQSTSKPVQQAAPADGTTQFDAELALAAYGYCKCLDVAEDIIADRELLASDSESLRAIATNLWMSSKHKVNTLAPEVVGSTKPINKGSAPQPAPAAQPAPDAAPDTSKVKSLNDMELVAKCIAGHQADDEDKLDDKGKAFLVVIDELMEERELWADAYDDLCSKHFFNNKAEADTVFDATSKLTGQKSPEIEKFIVCSPQAWREEVLEEIGRNSN